ncbi:hypothetical protein QQX98_002340 [Neonectria punicea]|uniref:BZIP domain-containing protein n=1 Tax=Neonectria punicea TaxID=979145 RepID=A0ABR1HJ37_9HYPO
MAEYQPHAPGPYTEVYPPYGIGEEVYSNTNPMGVESPLTAFSAPSNLHFPGDHCSALFDSPEDGGIYASAQAYNVLLVNGFVPGLNTISPDYWSAGLTGFAAESIAEPSPVAPSEYGPAPERSSRSSSTAGSPTGKHRRTPSDSPTRQSTIRESPRDEQIDMQTDGNRETPSSHDNDGSSRDGDTRPTIESLKRQASKQRRKRNAVAAHKSRTRRNQASQKLTTEEENKEKVNSKLINCVADLTLEIQELKMQLLQHTDCNCFQIQKYIAHEATQFVQGIEQTYDSEGPTTARP